MRGRPAVRCAMHRGWHRLLDIRCLLRCEIKDKKTQSQYDLYQESVFLDLISGCTQPPPLECFSGCCYATPHAKARILHYSPTHNVRAAFQCRAPSGSGGSIVMKVAAAFAFSNLDFKSRVRFWDCDSVPCLRLCVTRYHWVWHWGTVLAICPGHTESGQP
eukprot:3075191-Rhodomonas_salina.4